MFIALILVCALAAPTCTLGSAESVLQVPDEFMTLAACVRGGRGHVRDLAIENKSVRIMCIASTKAI